MTEPRATDEAATARLPALDATAAQPPSGSPGAALPGAPKPPGPAVQTPALAAPTARTQCPSCNAPVAPDQRYCVECGQRLAHARPPFMNDPTTSAPASGSPPPRKSRFQMSPSAALIAGVATLLIALGIGVYIGSLTKGATPARQVVLSPSAGATGTTGTGTTAATGTTASAGTTAKAGAASTAAAGSSKTPAKPTAAASKPANPTVQVGQKGSGQGYQHHEFTGHFFGGESEEDAGEEGEESSSSKGGKKK